MQNLLIKQFEVPKQAETTVALMAYVPAMTALLTDFAPVWVLACLVYAVLAYTSFQRWSGLLVSWWSGWAVLAFTYTAVHLIPVFHPLSTVQLLVGLTVFALSIFALFTLRRRNIFHNAVAILPIALELGRFALFRDLAGGMGGKMIMTVIAVIVYAAVILSLMHGQTRRYSWWLIMAGIAVYGVTAIVTSWPMILGYVLVYRYLPLLFLIFSLPLLGPLILQSAQRLSRVEWLPSATRLVALPLLTLMLCSWIAVAFLSTPAAPVESASTAVSTTRQKVIIDTDMSFDDYVALMYLLQHPEIEVVGINSVHGVATTSAGTENIRRVLALTGQEAIPVASGAAVPLASGRAFPPLWTTVMDSFTRPTLPSVASQPLPSATTLMQEVLHQSPDEVTIVALGPLTNVAQLFQQDPTAAEQLKTLVVGGGAIDAPNPTPDGEQDWNLWLDPAANEIVLNSGVEMIWTPLDLTHYNLRLDQVFTGRWTAANQQPEMMLMTRIPQMLVLFAGQSQPVWDLVTAAVVTNPEICTDWRALSLSSIQGSGATAGFLEINAGAPPNASVCMQGDQQTFEAAVLSGTR